MKKRNHKPPEVKKAQYDCPIKKVVDQLEKEEIENAILVAKAEQISNDL